MSNVIPMHKCGRCGGVSHPIELAKDGEVVTTGFGCDDCIEQIAGELAAVRPVFDTMIACGVDRTLANDTMTFLLARHYP